MFALPEIVRNMVQNSYDNTHIILGMLLREMKNSNFLQMW